MTIDELIQAARDRLDDTAGKKLWSDAELTRYANDAEVQACLRAEILFAGGGSPLMDSDNSDVCAIAVIAGQAQYPLHPSILRVNMAWMDSTNGYLIQMAEWNVYRHSAHVQITSAGPHAYVVGRNAINLYPQPASDDTLRLEVCRLPLKPIMQNGEKVSPEIPEQFHMGLVDWMCSMAFRKVDADSRNDNLALMYEQRFTAAFGVLPDVKAQLQRKILPPNMRMTNRRFTAGVQSRNGTY